MPSLSRVHGRSSLTNEKDHNYFICVGEFSTLIAQDPNGMSKSFKEALRVSL